MGRLTTHVLDTASGCPASDISVDLFRLDGDFKLIKRDRTNQDGRLDKPMLEGDEFSVGIYQLVFKAGEYFRRNTANLPDPAFVDEVVLRFGIADATTHYHVPLLVSPWSYSTYRGS